VPAMRAGDTELSLYGVGLQRWRHIFKVYVAGLYLGPGVQASAALTDVPKRLEIEYLHGIRARDFVLAIKQAIARNVEPGALAKLQPAIAHLCALYEDIGPGDRYALTYWPGAGTELTKNGRSLGVVGDAEFARALFAIWLGPKPLDEELKADLLGLR